LISDAQVAAVALRLGTAFHTADRDFGRFPSVRFVHALNEPLVIWMVKALGLVTPHGIQ